MNTSRLYRRIYKYMVLSIGLAIVLTMVILQVFFHFDRQGRKAGFLHDQVNSIMYLLDTEEIDTERLTQNIALLEKKLHWQIKYLPSDTRFTETNQRPQMTYSESAHTYSITLYLQQSKPSQDAISFVIPESSVGDSRPNPRPGPRPQRSPIHLPPHIFFPLCVLAGMLILLALFLIPLVKQIVKPIQILSGALQQVSTGDFATLSHIDHEFQPVIEVFNNMATKIQAMLHEKQRLIADVSHELRSPLARMRVSLELLNKEGKGNPKHIDRSIREVEELDHLINDLLDVSALELNAEKHPLDQIIIEKWVENSLEKYRLMLENNKISATTHYPKNLANVMGRKHLLQRALDNILSNTLKYAPQDSQIDISATATEDFVSLYIRDRGPGVPVSELHRLTEPFYRVDTSRTRKTGGTGLGLSIVEKIMELHHGSLTFSLPEDSDGGLVVCLKLPVTTTEVP